MIQQILKNSLSEALNSLYNLNTNANEIAIEITKSNFTGDYTFVVFNYLKNSNKNAEQTATQIGQFVKTNCNHVEDFNVIKGFLNLTISNNYWLQFLGSIYNHNYGFANPNTKEKVLVEYSSPNTNKPLHLGHIRNNLLGYSVAEILKANGNEVYTCNLINDRGIHICKSMFAWELMGRGETPESSGLKGDHLVGKYYVAFNRLHKLQTQELIDLDYSQEDAEKTAPCMLAVQEMLHRWEAGHEETREIWAKMNGWVYDGFAVTYKKLGVIFDKYYYESNTYLLGKEIVNEGLQKGVFYKKPNNSIWVDLTQDGLDEKLLLRADGTSVYITQDIGTAELKYKDFNAKKSIYVVGNEQDYHFKVLQLICQKLDKPYADGIYHLSYGMVELPHGKMKSREGTVVDADDLINEMEIAAAETTKALGKTEGLTETELQTLYQTIGMGALKYFILKVDPKKKMLFNPEESIDFHGNTGPFIQYTHARIKSILRNAGDFNTTAPLNQNLNKFERDLLLKTYQFKSVINEAAEALSPGIICNYTYELAKSFNQFYHECPIIIENEENVKVTRLLLCMLTAQIIKNSFKLLGIHVPEKM